MKNTNNRQERQALLDLALWQAQADIVSDSDLYLWLRERGLSAEVALRLRGLISVTAKVCRKAFSLGKILLLKAIEFISRHPHLSLGIALGAVLSGMAGAVPLLGHLLAPIVSLIFAVAGYRSDRESEGANYEDRGWLSIPQDLIEIARAFLEHLISTVRAVADEIVLSRQSGQ